jgi:hypothetical protein
MFPAAALWLLEGYRRNNHMVAGAVRALTELVVMHNCARWLDGKA